MVILRVLNETQISKSCNIPLLINKQIAEYSSGHIHKCLMIECAHDILELTNSYMYYDEFKKQWRFHNYKLGQFCLSCINDVQNHVTKIMKQSDLTKVTRKQVRDELRNYFGINFETNEWKAVIKYKIYELLR